jgi:hypothetical protein
MEISKQGNYSDPQNQISAMDTDEKDKLRTRLKYIILQYLRDNPPKSDITGLEPEMQTIYPADMYLTEEYQANAIRVIDSLTELFGLLEQHYNILNENI